MGENLKAIVAKAFKHYSNAAMERRLKTPDLFSETPFIFLHNYRCRATNGAILRCGDVVVIVSGKCGLQVWLQSHCIGEINGDDALELIKALNSEERAGNFLLARVEDELGADGTFSVMLVEGGSRVSIRETTTAL